jgi:hypothetical protein
MGKISKRLQRAMVLREVKKQIKEQLRSDRVNEELSGGGTNAGGREEEGGSLKETVDSMQKKRRTATGDFQTGDMVNLAVVVSYGKRGPRTDHKPALVLDGPDRWGEVLLMVVGDLEPQRYPAIMCRPYD